MNNLLLVLLTVSTITAAPVGHAYFGPSQVEYQGHVYLAFRDGLGTGHNIPADVVIWRDGAEIYRAKIADYGGAKHWLFSDDIAATKYGLILTMHECWWASEKIGTKYAVLFHARPWLLRSWDGMKWERIEAPRYGTMTILHGAPFELGGKLLFPAYAGDVWDKIYNDSRYGNRWAMVLAWDGGRWTIQSEHKPPKDTWWTEAPIVVMEDGAWIQAVRAQKKVADYTPEWIEVYKSTDNGRSWAYQARIGGNYPNLYRDGARLLLSYRGCGGAAVSASADGGASWSSCQVFERGASGIQFSRIGGELRAAWHIESGAELKQGVVK